jgi:hypothetical protein
MEKKGFWSRMNSQLKINMCRPYSKLAKGNHGLETPIAARIVSFFCDEAEK